MDIDKLITYLASTDEAYSKVQAEVSYGEDMLKHIKGTYISNIAQVSVSKATEDFYGSASYTNHISKLHTLNLQLLELRNKRRTAEMKIEVWRTLEASRRKGNI